MSQGINREYIFKREQDKKKYRKLISQYFNKYNVEIIAYCIMYNHVHLLIKSEKIENMSNFMHQINMEYAIYYNKNRNRVGYVFRSRYKSEEIDNEKYLFNCIEYIHNNPVKAHICKKKEDYKYSSYNCKIKENKIISKNWRKLYHCKEENDENNFSFISTEEERKQEIEETIEKFLYKNNLNIEKIKENDEKLIKIVKILVNKKVSIRKIEKIFRVDKKKIKKLIEENS